MKDDLADISQHDLAVLTSPGWKLLSKSEILTLVYFACTKNACSCADEVCKSPLFESNQELGRSSVAAALKRLSSCRLIEVTEPYLQERQKRGRRPIPYKITENGLAYVCGVKKLISLLKE